MSKGNGKVNPNTKTDDDLVAAGFHRLDKEFSKRPPKIKWGAIYTKAQKQDKIPYLEKLAASMNHAAYLIQGERDQLGALCEKKEAQIQSLKKGLDQNNEMIQGQITKMNEERQLYNAAIAELRAKVRELENGDND